MFSTVSNTLVPRLNRTLSCIFYLVKFIRPDEVGQCCIISVSLRKSWWVSACEREKKKNAQISLDVSDKWKKKSLLLRDKDSVFFELLNCLLFGSVGRGSCDEGNAFASLSRNQFYLWDLDCGDHLVANTVGLALVFAWQQTRCLMCPLPAKGHVHKTLSPLRWPRWVFLPCGADNGCPSAH